MQEEVEKMSDIIDVGAHVANAINEAAVEEARRRAEPEQVQNPDGTWPVTECECGEPLGARATLGKIRCIECQEALEKKRGP